LEFRIFVKGEPAALGSYMRHLRSRIPMSVIGITTAGLPKNVFGVIDAIDMGHPDQPLYPVRITVIQAGF
jgi:hypothetical protein